MAISMVYPLPVGNALQLVLQPMTGVGRVRVRVLRKAADDFAGRDDPDAIVVYDGEQIPGLIDDAGLINGVRAYYRAYRLVGALWTVGATMSGVPGSTFRGASVSPQAVVRDRLELGLKVLVDRGVLRHAAGFVPVLTASPILEDADFPLVTTMLQDDGSDNRYIGDFAVRDLPLDSGVIESMDVYLSRVQMTVVGWSRNVDERIVLRDAIKSVLLANQPVFDQHGLTEIAMRFSDNDDFESYGAPMYQAVCAFSCLAPSAVAGTDPVIREVNTTIY